MEQALKQRETLLPWPVILETYYITQQEEGQAEADKRFALIKQLKATILYDMDEATLLTAARLKACIAYRWLTPSLPPLLFGMRILLHKDPEFEVLSGLLSMEALPYKSS